MRDPWKKLLSNRASRKAYREANQEKLKAQSKAYREANREKIKARKKAEYEANREAILASRKVYYQANKEKLKARKKTYRDANQEKLVAYRETNREEINAKARAKYHANTESELARNKAYREANRDKINAQARVYKEANKEKIKAYLEANRDKINARGRSKYVSNIPFKLCSMVKHASKRVTGRIATKQEVTDLLGCSLEEYKEYLESKFQQGMTWDNHTVDGWHIDHILPLNESGTTLTEEEKIKRLHYTNTQPLWAKDNMAKGNKAQAVIEEK